MENLSTSRPLARKLREGWGKLRRFYLCQLRPGKVRARIALRKGACRGCAECCELFFRCPHLGPDRRCTEYDSRYKPCIAYPIDERDVRNMDCGFTFDAEEPGRPRPLGLPLAPWGARELVQMGVACGLGAAAGLGISWLDGVPAGYALTAGFAALFAFGLFFFRDPRRAVPAGGGLLAPADGRVTDVREVEEPEFLGGRALRVGIFMSVFDVHVNRAPCAGRVRFLRHREGAFRNVLFEAAWEKNENVLLGLEAEGGPVAVRLVAGAIARRIVLDPRPGSWVARGERMGMVKFGSRAELLVPAGAGWRAAVSPGTAVKGGLTPLLVREDGGGTASGEGP